MVLICAQPQCQRGQLALEVGVRHAPRSSRARERAQRWHRRAHLRAQVTHERALLALARPVAHDCLPLLVRQLVPPQRRRSARKQEHGQVVQSYQLVDGRLEVAVKYHLTEGAVNGMEAHAIHGRAKTHAKGFVRVCDVHLANRNDEVA